MEGANNIARNKTKNCINTLKRPLAAQTCTNIVKVLRNSLNEYLPPRKGYNVHCMIITI
jgi:hypothetical protein